MRTNKEIAEEALRRGAIIRRRSENRKRVVYSVSAVAACLIAVAGLSFVILSLSSGNPVTPEGVYSATLFSGSTAGGYVLIGVIGFVLGSAVTIFCYRKFKKD